jgi:hypothetical protein
MFNKINGDNGVITGSDPDKRLFLCDNRSNLGCFSLLGPAFWGQKLCFKGFAWGIYSFFAPGWVISIFKYCCCWIFKSCRIFNIVL